MSLLLTLYLLKILFKKVLIIFIENYLNTDLQFSITKLSFTSNLFYEAIYIRTEIIDIAFFDCNCLLISVSI